MDKIRLRRIAKEKREQVTLKQATRRDGLIFENLQSLPEYCDAKTIFCYISVSREIDTLRIIRDILARGAHVCVPVSDGHGSMCARELYSLSSLSLGRYGIPVPPEDAAVVLKDEIDFCIVPALLCDHEGYRLGYGGGYYDRYFEDFKGISAVLCGEDFLMDTSLVREETDRPCDIVVTERQVIRCGHGRVGGGVYAG